MNPQPYASGFAGTRGALTSATALAAVHRCWCWAAIIALAVLLLMGESILEDQAAPKWQLALPSGSPESSNQWP